MSRIKNVFQTGRKALIGYLTVGYPGLETTYQAALALAEGGCDIIELGIPFSDPLADGATIQQASFEALEQGITPRDALALASRLRERLDTPLVFMSYYNPVASYGAEAFCRAAAAAGADGLIIPDLPPEEGGEIGEAGSRHGIDLIYLLTPASTEDRIRLVAERSQGFIYLVSITGTTGARTSLPAGLEEFVGRVRRVTDKPLCVGFGVSGPEAARRVAQVADGVIVGSRLVQLIGADPTLASLRETVAGLRGALV